MNKPMRFLIYYVTCNIPGGGGYTGHNIHTVIITYSNALLNTFTAIFSYSIRGVVMICYVTSTPGGNSGPNI